MNTAKLAKGSEKASLGKQDKPTSDVGDALWNVRNPGLSLL